MQRHPSRHQRYRAAANRQALHQQRCPSHPRAGGRTPQLAGTTGQPHPPHLLLHLLPHLLPRPWHRHWRQTPSPRQPQHRRAAAARRQTMMCRQHGRRAGRWLQPRARCSCQPQSPPVEASTRRTSSPPCWVVAVTGNQTFAAQGMSHWVCRAPSCTSALWQGRMSLSGQTRRSPTPRRPHQACGAASSRTGSSTRR